jgi:DNA-binding GntR family transcriptional regulator
MERAWRAEMSELEQERGALERGDPPKTAVQQAYLFIKGEIMAFRFKPGDPLSEVHLSEMIGVSRTPIRDALRRLENEGLAKTIQYKGSFVAPIAIEDLMEIYNIRELLEGFAAFLAAARIDLTRILEIETWLQAIETDNMTPLQITELTEIDLECHQIILKASENGRLRSITNMLNDQAMRFRYIGVAYRPGRTQQELLQIIDGLKDRNAPAAEEAMRKHIRGATEDIIKAFAAHKGPPVVYQRDL